jgi:quercetin dioxygenase-like cupin family protein
MTAHKDADSRPSAFRSKKDGFRWEGVEFLPYKEEGSAPFKDISRQVLVQDANLACELRYFEMAPGGHSTLERHEHVHGVMILRGRGHCLVGDEVREVGERDLVTIPPMTWHQFRASRGEPFGFLCMVNVERDRPQLPTEEDIAALRRNPAVAAFLDWRFD